MLKLRGDVLMSRLEGEMEAEFLCHGFNDRANSEDVGEWGINPIARVNMFKD